MNSLPYENFDQLVLCLHSVFKGNNEDVKRATEIFDLMSGNLTHFADSLLGVVTCENTDGN